MAMSENVAIDVVLGLIPNKFHPVDLMGNPSSHNGETYTIGMSEYKKSTIITNLNNLSVGPGNRKGNHVKKGYKPHYRKYKDGKFSLLNITASDNVCFEEVINVPKIVGHPNSGKQRGKSKKINKDSIYKDFVNYLGCNPFRIYLGDGRWYPHGKAIVGWKNRLDYYAWPLNTNKPGNPVKWENTDNKLSKFIDRLTNLIDAAKLNEFPVNKQRSIALDIYNDIKKWGNPRGNDRDGKQILEIIMKISANDVSDMPVDSTLTKLYAFTKPDEYAIYDTRVAAAIVTVAEDLYRRDKINKFQDEFPNLGHMKYAANSGTRPRGIRSKWPNAYQVWNAQLDANKLCIGIRDELNKAGIDGNEDWNLRQVEAVLFMEGY